MDVWEILRGGGNERVSDTHTLEPYSSSLNSLHDTHTTITRLLSAYISCISEQRGGGGSLLAKKIGAWYACVRVYVNFGVSMGWDTVETVLYRDSQP